MTPHRRVASLTLAGVVLLGACVPRAGVMNEDQRRAVIASVDSATRAFERAQRARDPERVVAHLAPDFYMYADGRRLDHGSVVGNIRRDFAAVRHVEPGFYDLEVAAQAPTAAVASFRFRDSIVGIDGAVRRSHGTTTLAWARRGADWLIVYAVADHESEAAR